MNPLVSIVVPVYNVEMYLLRFIQSILKQTYNNFELLLIDDGSCDASGIICDEQAKTDNRIKVIHQSNAGAAAARNRGIQLATGEYIAFADSDDVVSEKWVERMISYADEETLPIGAYCSIEEELGKRRVLPIEAEKIVSNEKYIQFGVVGIAGYLCNALYSRKVIMKNNLLLKERLALGDYNEDLTFALAYASKIKNIIYTGYSDYMYDRHGDSLSTSYPQFYFDKYEEKYRLWESFTTDKCRCVDDNMAGIATNCLYHFLTAMQLEVDKLTFSSFKSCYERFKYIINSEAVQQCVLIANADKENFFIIKCIQEKHVNTLWLMYTLIKLKQNFLKGRTSR